jgi:DNA-binding MarR family transcriptional regulator
MNEPYNLGELIEMLSYSMEQHETQVIAGSEFSALTMSQIHYLDMIHHLQKPTLSDLARRMKVSKPTVTVAVETLGRKGYVRKVRSLEDKRILNVHLTARGETIAELHDQIHRGYADRIDAVLDSTDLASLSEVLNKVLTRLDV